MRARSGRWPAPAPALAWLVGVLMAANLAANDAPAPQAVVTVQIATPAEMATTPIQPVLIPVQSAVDRCVANQAALAPYAVLSAQMLAEEEAAQAAQAKAEKRPFTRVVLPANIRPPPMSRIDAAEPPTGPLPRELSATVPAGRYDLGLQIGSGVWMWWPDQPIDAGVVMQGLTVPATGSVRLTWSVDQPLHGAVDEPEPLRMADLVGRLRRVSMAGLMREGRVWAAAQRISEHEFYLPTVPPGEYTLVLHHTYERFLCVEQKVVVQSGAETAVTVKARRSLQGGVGLAYYNPSKNKYEPLHTAGHVYDLNLNLAFPCTSTLAKSETAGGLAQEYVIAMYGGLLTTDQYRLFLEAPQFRQIHGQAVSVHRMPPPPARLARPGAAAAAEPEVAVENYKPTIVRLQPLSAISRKTASTAGAPSRYYLQPVRK